MVMAKNGMRVGLDLEQSSIAAVQVKPGKQHNVLTHAAIRGLPEGLVFEGEVVDSDALANELKTLWKEGGFASKRVQLGVANQKIVVRTMEFPQIDEKELRAAIEFQAQEHIPIPVDEAILDYKVLSTHVDDDGSIKQRILLVAAQREMVKQFMNVAKKAGLMIDGIDLQAFAMIRALAPKPSFIDQGAPEGTTGEVVALVNIGSGITNLVIAANGVTQFTRVINLGSEALTQSLMNHRNMPYEEADALRIQVGLAGDQPDQPGDLTLETLAEIHQSFDRACEPFSDELRRSIDYYHTQEHVGEISKLVLSGDGALTRNIAYSLSQGLHLPVEIGNPLREVSENKTKLTEVQLEWMAPRLAIAIGLALDDEG
jgi:type IV pilus assembly protein PilM